MVLRNLEDRLEQAVEGMFARVFRTGLQPVEVARRLIKEIDAKQALDARGQAIAPNAFQVHLATADHERFASVDDALSREFATTIREHAQQESLRFLGRVSVELVDDPSLVVGRCRVTSAFDQHASVGTAPAYLELPDGSHLELGPQIVTFGRMTDCTVVLADSNSSRHHAELQPDGDTYVLVDLGSTNGTKVNGSRIHQQTLADGDELTFGTIVIRFHLL